MDRHELRKAIRQGQDAIDTLIGLGYKYNTPVNGKPNWERPSAESPIGRLMEALQAEVAKLETIKTLEDVKVPMADVGKSIDRNQNPATMEANVGRRFKLAGVPDWHVLARELRLGDAWDVYVAKAVRFIPPFHHAHFSGWAVEFDFPRLDRTLWVPVSRCKFL